MEILFLLGGIVFGGLLSYLLTKTKFMKVKFEIEKEKSLLAYQSQSLLKEKETLQQTTEQQQLKNEEQREQLARAEADMANLKQKLEIQEKETAKIQQKFTADFEHIAARILKQNTEDFSLLNQKSITELLSPLKEKITTFEKKVEDTYEKGLKDQVDMKAELRKLHDLNLKISDEANNLTKALKGDVKKQGNWGEVVLERILERSGLSEGSEYYKQKSTHTDDGQRLQPDVVIQLPDQKHIIIDSKVSLVAYERLTNANNEKDRLAFAKEHLQSLRTHVKTLSDKHYQNLPNYNSPDFVLLFIPIESSFSTAVQEDQDLFSFAWDNKVVIVSPSTLLATLRTIASIWQQENQNRNAQEIARQGGALYDKFAAFVIDMEAIGKNIEGTQKAYNQALNKLYTGNGNLIRRAENIRKLGAKTTRKLPTSTTDSEE